MDYESTYFGVLVWGSITILNIIVFTIISHPKNWAKEKTPKIILSAAITTTIIHIIALFDSPADVFMWILVSFPVVGVISVVILYMLKFIAGIISDAKSKKV